jgi:probable F420-dependent oxidoreductase
MKVDGTIGFDPVGIPDAARRLEEAGYDGAWAPETGRDPFVALAVAATATERIELATGIAVAFARNPMTLAMLSNDLHQLSRGRFILGLGSQIKAHITKRFSMPWSHPAPRMRELILAVRAIWAAWQGEGTLDFRGEFYTHTLMTPFFDPGPNPYGHPPIVLAAVGAHMAEVAGEVADGLLVHPFTTARYLEEVSLPAALRGAGTAGKSRADLTVVLPGFVVTGTDDAETAASAEAARRQIAFYGSTPAYRQVLELHGWGDLQGELHARSRRGEWREMGELVDDEVLETFAVVAPPGDLATAVLARWGGLVDRFSFYGSVPESHAAEMIARLQRHPDGARGEADA